MRVNFRVKIGPLTFFVMWALTQTLEGVTSLLPDSRHTIMWDLEGCSLEQAQETLRMVQMKYNLSHVYIVSDTEGSYRAWCFSKVDLKTLLHVLIDTEHLDYSFLYYTVKRKKATLRTGSKKGRPLQHLVSVLESFPAPFPDIVETAVYDTGLVKKGHLVLLGERDGQVSRGF